MVIAFEFCFKQVYYKKVLLLMNIKNESRILTEKRKDNENSFIF